ncbi:MAG: hypothetical protein A4E55_00233 [Pelotomaculum sp. PtaU1.Bin035]|nr:MAG: hypothetical protein A4E55_00233 [Pelotomaculum sp. PtaU1.Bin035]
MLQLNVEMLKRVQGDPCRFDFLAELPPFELQGKNLSFPGPVKASLVVNSTGSALAVEGEVSGKLSLTCDRCLEHFDYSFEVPIKENYTRSTEGGGDEVVSFAGDILDITPEVIKSIILSLPMKAICREDCRGLCPSCGCNLNKDRCDCGKEDTDLRLSVLKDLIEKSSK